MVTGTHFCDTELGQGSRDGLRVGELGAKPVSLRGRASSTARRVGISRVHRAGRCRCNRQPGGEAT
eukprot:15011718-Alexandrium_andersonii.AAC.1